MTSNDGKILMLITAASTAEAAKIGKALVEKRLAACCSIIPGVQSIYWWDEEICEDAEVMLLIKTMKSAESDVMKTIQTLHSYELPEMISLSMDSGSPQYFEWIEKNVLKPGKD